MVRAKVSLGQSASELHDKRTAMVKELVAKENAEFDAKTARLKSLRLAKESAEPAPVAKSEKKTRGR